MNFQRAKQVLARGLRLLCPACGEGRVFSAVVKTNDRCSVCGMVFLREQGYFVGSIYINVIFTEAVIVIAFVVCLFIMSAGDERIYYFLIALAFTVPLAFYRHARSLWLSFDYLIDPPEKQNRG